MINIFGNLACIALVAGFISMFAISLKFLNALSQPYDTELKEKANGSRN